MAATDLGACEWFVWDLRRSNLIDRGQLDQVVGEFLRKHPRAEPPALAEFLVTKNILTQFQSERILQGKTQGLVLGPYTLLDSIGTGSMGTVYKALSKTDNKQYAVKVLPRRSMWNVRLARRQVRSFEQFKHPAVVPFVDVGTSGGLHYLSWPLVEGTTIESFVAERGKLAPDVAALYTLQIAQGLNACHQRGIFHGLLKPSNIMVTSEGQATILDFGIGSLLAENEGESLVDTMSTANTMTSGLDCASPESIMEPTNRTAAGDQYSLGCILYYFLSGKYPFPEGSAVEKMMAHQYKQPTPVKELVPEVSAELEEILEKLMQKSPEARYASTEEIVEALRPHAAQAAPAPAKARPTAARAPAPAADNGRPAAAPRAAASAPAAPARKTSPTAPPAAAAASSAKAPAAKSLRQSLGAAVPAPPPPPTSPPKRELPPTDDEDEEEMDDETEDEDEDEEDEDEEEEESDEEGRLGNIFIIVGAVLVCGLVFYLAMNFFKQ